MCFQGPAEDHGTPPNCGALRQPRYQHPFSLRMAFRVKAPKTEKKTLSRTSAGIHRLCSFARSCFVHTMSIYTSGSRKHLSTDYRSVDLPGLSYGILTVFPFAIELPTGDSRPSYE